MDDTTEPTPPTPAARGRTKDIALAVGGLVVGAALAEYPGATIDRVETDSDGVYEAHLTTADGQRLTVEVGEDLAVTGVEAGGGPGGHGGHGNHPGEDDRGEDDPASPFGTG